MTAGRARALSLSPHSRPLKPAAILPPPLSAHRYNTNGILQWIKMANNDGDDADSRMEATGCALDNSGNIALVGSMQGHADDQYFTSVKGAGGSFLTPPTSSNLDFFGVVWTLDVSDGSESVAPFFIGNRFADSSQKYSQTISFDSNGDMTIVGIFDDSGLTIDGMSLTHGGECPTDTDGFIYHSGTQKYLVKGGGSSRVRLGGYAPGLHHDVGQNALTLNPATGAACVSGQYATSYSDGRRLSESSGGCRRRLGEEKRTLDPVRRLSESGGCRRQLGESLSAYSRRLSESSGGCNMAAVTFGDVTEIAAPSEDMGDDAFVWCHGSTAGTDSPSPPPPSPSPPPPSPSPPSPGDGATVTTDHAISFAVIASGDVGDYTTEVTDAIAVKVAEAAGVDANAVSVTVTAGSVVITIVVYANSASAATTVGDTLESDFADAASATAFLSSISGVDIQVEAVTPIVSGTDAGGEDAISAATGGGGLDGGIIAGIIVGVLAVLAIGGYLVAVKGKAGAGGSGKSVTQESASV
jgi:hypothetical protein